MTDPPSVGDCSVLIPVRPRRDQGVVCRVHGRVIGGHPNLADRSPMIRVDERRLDRAGALAVAVRRQVDRPGAIAQVEPHVSRRRCARRGVAWRVDRGRRSGETSAGCRDTASVEVDQHRRAGARGAGDAHHQGFGAVLVELAMDTNQDEIVDHRDREGGIGGGTWGMGHDTPPWSRKLDEVR